MTAAGPDHYVEIVARVCAMCFDGKLPRTDDARFVTSIMAGLPDLQDQPEPVRASFAAGLRGAVDLLRESENARWKN